MPFGRRSPFEALALPGAILAYKYSQFRQRRREAASRRVTERELSALHYKIVSVINVYISTGIVRFDLIAMQCFHSIMLMVTDKMHSLSKITLNPRVPTLICIAKPL